MAEQIAHDDVSQTTRAFTLLRKLSKGEKLTSSETHELLQIQKKIASSDMIPQLQSGLEILSTKIDAQSSRIDTKIDAQSTKIDAQSTKIDAQNSRIDAKIDAQNTKYNVLIVIISIIGAALTIALSIN